MKVKALEAGFFGGFRRRAGDVFEVPEGTKGRWFTEVKTIGAPMDNAEKPETEAEKKARLKAEAKAAAQKAKEPNTLSQIARGAQNGQTMVDALAPVDKDADIA